MVLSHQSEPGLGVCFVLVLQEEVDAGAIIVQEAVPILSGDTEDALSERIKEAEHQAYPRALDLVASGRVRLGDDGRIIWGSSRFQES